MDDYLEVQRDLVSRYIFRVVITILTKSSLTLQVYSAKKTLNPRPQYPKPYPKAPM